MHEWKAVEMLIKKLEGKMPKKITIELGEMVSDPKIFEEIFKEYVKGTELNGIKIDIKSVPIRIRCDCGWEGYMKMKKHIHFVRCPACGKIANIIEGNKLKILSLE